MRRCLPLAALLLLTSCQTAEARDARVERMIATSLVKVYVTANPPDYQSPWQRGGIESSTGSGVIISGNRILTAAHVVADQVSVEVKRSGGTRRFAARVAHVDGGRVEIDDAAGTVFLPEEGMVLGLGGIAKGHALDRAAEALRQEGVDGFLISAAGQMW